MFRYFDDGDRVGFEADSVKELTKLSENKEALDKLAVAIKDINQARTENSKNALKDLMTETIADIHSISTAETKEIKKEVKKTKTTTNVVLGVSIATLLIVGGDKGYELYKKFIKPKKSAVDKKPTVKK